MVNCVDCICWSRGVMRKQVLMYRKRYIIETLCPTKKNDVKPCSINQSQKKRDHFYPRDAMLARVIATATCLSVFPSVRLSLCPSITRRYCVKTKKASVMISSPSGSPKTLVFWYQMSSPNSNGFPPIGPNGASKKGGVWKFSDFLALSVNQYLQNDSRYGQSYY